MPPASPGAFRIHSAVTSPYPTARPGGLRRVETGGMPR